MVHNGSGNVDGNGTDDLGYWGSGSATLSGDGLTLDPLGELHGTLLFEGTFNSISFTTSTFENWHGFTIGAAGPGLPPVPLPAGFWLLLGGTGALMALRRK